jgi:iron complex outermembrane recepter protein
MSELINTRKTATNFRWQLLASVSAIALIGFVYEADLAMAADTDSDRPLVWIELGGQLSRLIDGQETFAPAFPNSPPRPSILEPSQKLDGPPHFAIDEEAKLSFQPDNSDWVLSASVRFGRSANSKHAHQQTNPHAFTKYFYTSNATYQGGIPHRNKNKQVNTPQNAKFADTLVENRGQHLIADFQAGKDVGLGMFGKGGSSTINLGVRFAQFSAKSNIAIKSNPDWKFHYKYFPSLVGPNLPSSKVVTGSIFHSNAANLVATRQFHGVGPSLSWNASVPILGVQQDSQVIFDWGINAAVLFGRQRTRVDHHAMGQYHPAGKYVHPHVTYAPPPVVDLTRARTVTVPNVGGFAGLSFRYANAKISAGYRADLFFGAMDGGIDTAKKENVGFYGPFASVSVGIGG